MIESNNPVFAVLDSLSSSGLTILMRRILRVCLPIWDFGMLIADF